jgi:asparaginyl-tRNA synthetase
VIVTDYPKDIKAFYRSRNAGEETVRAMDILVPRIGEIIGGSERESRYDVLLNRIREMDLPEEHYWWHLDLRKYGTAPHSGFGLGFERAIQYVTGMANIRVASIPFPRASGLLEF